MTSKSSNTPSVQTPAHPAPGDEFLVGLNAAQREAVTHKDGPMLVLAGPGSGKTRVVTHRVAWLLQNGVREYQIAALTFTNKAADEMRTRLQNLVPGARVWIGTFHRFCASLLRRYAGYVGLQENFAIYDADESKKLLEEVVPKNSLPNGVDIGKIASAISWAKNSLVAAEEYSASTGSMLGRIVEEAYPAYQNALKRANAVDFDDLLFHIAVLLKQQPEIRAALDSKFRYILVDEYQDTNLVQYTIARALSLDYPNLAVTGDPDQSIYGWRGANIQNILNFEQDFENVKVVRLEQNYRSDKSVLRVADAVIRNNVYRKDKNLFTENDEGVPPRVMVCFDQDEEAETIAAEIAAEVAAGRRHPRDYAIFYRMNALSRNLEYALKRYGVPFQLVRGLEFFNRREIKDVCAYLQLVYNPNDVVSFKRVINLPARGIGRVSLARLEQYAEDHAISLMDAAREAADIPGLSAKVRKALASFTSLISKTRESFDAGDDLEIALGILMRETQYIEFLRASAESEEDDQRVANVQEFLSEAREFDADYAKMEEDEGFADPLGLGGVKRDRLGFFLEQIALVSDVDAWDASDDRVSLMTLHAAKGLEFPVVYLIAVEDGVLPHERSTRDKRQLEEERRLLFVGLTRAMQELRISRTRYREFRGSCVPAISSRFLFEFPKNGIDSYDTREDWLKAREQEAKNDPGANIAIPKFFERREGVSQRQALWQDEIGAPDEEDEFAAPRSALLAGAGRKNSRKSKNSEDDYVDPAPEDDYAQAAPDEELFVESEYVDEPYEQEYSEPVFVRDSETEPEYEPAPKAKKSAKAPRKRATKSSKTPTVAPGAITTAAALAGDDDGKTARPPKEIVVNALVRHRKYGIGTVQKLSGPSFDRIATVSFISAAGIVELSVKDPDLSLVAIGRRDAD